MNRLPRYDSKTGRSELAVYSTLGLAAGALITIAALDAMKLASSLDSVASLWRDGPVVAQGQRLNQTLTNASFRRPFVPGGQVLSRPSPTEPSLPCCYQRTSYGWRLYFPGDNAQ